MQILRRVFCLASAIMCMVSFADDTKVSANSSWCENFDRAQGNGLPVNWAVEGKKWRVPVTQCKVRNSVLEVVCNRSTGGIAQELKGVDLNRTPIMRWRWRVISFPNNADGRNRKRDDQPVAIYLAMEGGAFSKKSIAYRWEGLTPVGFHGATKYAGVLTVNYIAMRNQASCKVGEWVTETRNVAEDFKRIYGTVPSRFGISVNGNSQYTKSYTVAEIDFIEFIPASK